MINWPATKLPSHFTMPFCQRARVVTISSSTHARRGATAVCPRAPKALATRLHGYIQMLLEHASLMGKMHASYPRLNHKPTTISYTTSYRKLKRLRRSSTDLAFFT